MIALDNVSILKPGVFDRDPILVAATATFGSHARVGILATPGTGKSSLARVLAGVDAPDAGTVHSEGRVSWPIGFAGFLHPKLTVGDNLKIFSRMTGVHDAAVAEFCDEFCGIAGLGERVMENLTPTQRALLAYACAVSVPGPAMWIADEVISVGEPQERERCNKVLEERLNDGGLVFMSRNVRQLKQYCDRFYVVINQQLVPCEDLDVAKEALEIEAKNKRMRH